MITERSSFFALPASTIGELSQLRKRWHDAVKELRADSDIIMNQMYRRADDVAVHRVTFTQHDNVSAIVDVAIYIVTKVRERGASEIVAPDECPAFRQAIDALEAQLGGEQPLLYQVTRRSALGWPPAAYRPIYRAMRDVLHRAIAAHAGFTWLYYDDNAEPELVEQQRRDARREQSLAAPDPLPSTEDSDRYMAALQAELEERVERGRALARENDRLRNPNVANPDTLVLYAVPARHVNTLRALHEVCKRPIAWDDEPPWSPADDPSTRFARLAWEDAEAEMCLSERGHQSALIVLERMLAQYTPDAVLTSGVYDPAQARALARATTDWLTHIGGEHAAIDAITAESYGNSQAHTAHVLGRWRALLAHAIDRGCGVIRLLEPWA